MKIFIIFIVLLMTIGMFFSVNTYNQGKDVVTGRTYQGRIYLDEQEYEGFKQFLAINPEVKIYKLDVLSSPNALIDMVLYAPAPIELPYDIKITVHYLSSKSVLFGYFILIFVAGGCTILLTWYIRNGPEPKGGNSE